MDYILCFKDERFGINLLEVDMGNPGLSDQLINPKGDRNGF